MPEELGRITKPAVDDYGKGRKLFFVPLIFAPPGIPLDFLEKVNRYWDEVEAHVVNLESKFGPVTRVYHELIPVGDEEGAKAVEQLNDASHQVVRKRLDNKAKLQPVEDPELLTEYMDWSRCLTIGLQNRNVITRVYESYLDVQKRRNEDIAKKLDETLEQGEVGILLMREGHHIQFPSDIQVFYVSPPTLNEIERWLRDRESEAISRDENEAESQEEKPSEVNEE